VSIFPLNLPPPKKKVISAIALFDKYFEFRRSDLALGTQKKYEALRSQLYQELGESSAELDIDTILRFKNWLSNNFASVTSKDKIAILKAVWRWGIHRNLIKSNPWTEVKFKKEIKKKSEPLTLEESKQIIAEFRESRPFYADLVEFKLLTGVRTGEAFALQWGDFNDSLTQLTIYKSFNSSTKELKPVKQEDIRKIDFTPRVTKLLLRRREQAITKNKKNISNQLVFPNTEGGYMIARNFSKRHWRPVLTKLGIDYRRPYDTRKTLVSHAIEQGMSPVDVAKYVGNTPKTIYESYLGSVKKIIPPDFLSDDSILDDDI
jgi:integrase